jgi:hypothetical protein
LWTGDQRESAANWQQSGEGGDHGSVGPAHPWTRCASSKDGELVAQDEDLDLLGLSDRMRSTVQPRSLDNIR